MCEPAGNLEGPDVLAGSAIGKKLHELLNASGELPMVSFQQDDHLGAVRRVQLAQNGSWCCTRRGTAIRVCLLVHDSRVHGELWWTSDGERPMFYLPVITRLLVHENGKAPDP